MSIPTPTKRACDACHRRKVGTAQSTSAFYHLHFITCQQADLSLRFVVIVVSHVAIAVKQVFPAPTMPFRRRRVPKEAGPKSSLN